MTMELNFRPSPVSVTTPTMMPAAAQVTPTLSIPTVPSRSACTSRESRRALQSAAGRQPDGCSIDQGSSAQSRCRKLTTKAVTTAQNTAAVGE